MVCCGELSILENPAVLNDPATSAYKDVVNLLSYPSNKDKVQQCNSGLWYQEPAILNLMDLADFRKRDGGVSGTRPVGTNSAHSQP